jgi:hypothetical protein
MSAVIAVVVIVGIVMVAWGIAMAISLRGQTESVAHALGTIPGITPHHLICCSTIGVALDQTTKRMGLVINVRDEITVRTYPFSAITGVDIERTDGASTTKRTGQATFKTNDSLRKLTLAITLADGEIPLIRYPLYVSFQDNPSLLQDRAVEQANLWRGLLSSIVRENAAVVDSGNEALAAPQSSGLASELDKLDRLHRTGALTSDEFQAAKLRLLA